MKLRLASGGDNFDIYFIVEANDKSPAIEFLKKLESRDRDSYRSMLWRLKKHADHGPLKNPRHSKAIKGRDNFFEFKTRHGDRLLYFYHPNMRGATVITNGFHKGAPEKAQFDRAERLRTAVLQEEENHDRTQGWAYP